MNSEFSPTLTPYAPHPSSRAASLETLLHLTFAPDAKLSSDEVRARRDVLAMYVSWGVDPAYDLEQDQSQALVTLLPRGGAAAPRVSARPLSLWFSPDAPYYHRIPSQWPHVPLPRGYIRSAQLNAARNGDGIGFGEAVANSDDPQLRVHSQWFQQADTRRVFRFRMATDWYRQIPTNDAGDRHVIFVDPSTRTYISSYKTSLDRATGGVRGLYVSAPRSFNSLGDQGGSNAAGFADLPVMIQPGEATDPDHEIQHAIGGAVRRTWAARVYPATSMDAGVLTGIDTCSRKGPMNSGLVPYGGVIQLDPALDLDALRLSLPALRILRAMQVYGYYVMDFGCADIDIYTAIDASELDTYGGPWGNDSGPGVQNEIEQVLANAQLYVVPPIMKR
jgi:hypothetical protein